MTLRDTPWVDTSFARLWQRIEAASPEPEWMPIRRPGSLKMQEYGCGFYGCVMPTSDPRVVCKLTTDVTEAVFVAAVLSLPSKSPVYDGMVRYYAVYELPRDVVSALVPPDRNPEGRVFVLWREAVDEVSIADASLDSAVMGALQEYKKSTRAMFSSWYKLTGRKDSFDKVLRFMEYPDDVLEQEFLQAQKDLSQGTPEASVRYWALRYVAFVKTIPFALAGISSLGFVLLGVRKTLTYLYSKGLVLGDLHKGNFGFVDRGEGRRLVITDPGHAMPFVKKWTKIKVPVLP